MRRVPIERRPVSPWNIIGWLILFGFGVFVALVALVIFAAVLAANGG